MQSGELDLSNAHTLIGEPLAETFLHAYLENIGAEIEVIDHDTYISDIESGLEVRTRNEHGSVEKIDTIRIYLQKEMVDDDDATSGSYEPYCGILPFGLKQDLDKTAVISKLGTPDLEREELENTAIGSFSGIFVYYYQLDRQVSIGFDGGEKILSVAFSNKL